MNIKENVIKLSDILLLKNMDNTMKIKEALFKLDDFCRVNKIEYMVTGTTALAMLGVPSNPQDIYKGISFERRAGSKVKRTSIPVWP